MRWRREHSAERLPDPGWQPPDRIADRDALAALLRSLGKRQRAVLVLRYYHDYSAEETAAVLDVSPGTVKSQSARGLEALRTAAAANPH
ncbi:hypothetical protein Val02_84250 [Virgisporangium aliadipatigenens]|uniref:RNA polymerase sigma factor 70 region 4 type 2 domain-containing protein n=1 Tax=Virgisporangium aliadipatigenens TaxID=741659 RepID=A0A8J3YTT6_9ACTN|nr:hypothetical protein Val02_84250 [Virgisporangium aliadipatigenens]